MTIIKNYNKIIELNNELTSLYKFKTTIKKQINENSLKIEKLLKTNNNYIDLSNEIQNKINNIIQELCNYTFKIK